MKSFHFQQIFTAILLAGCVQAQGTNLFTDNFNAEDTANFDGAPLTGRLGGVASTETFLQADAVQQAISGGALAMQGNGAGGGGVRFGGRPPVMTGRVQRPERQSFLPVASW